jgi:hypothetical protein
MAAGTERNGLARRGLWIALLTGATIVGSFIFACATPFPALGALSALYMRKRDAFALTFVNWLANQIIGYGFLHYPRDFNSFAWGVAIGISALVATAVAFLAENLAARAGWIAAALAAFISAFVAYEFSLYAATPLLGDDGGFSAKIIAYVAEVNGIAFAGLLVLQGIGLSTGLASVPRMANPA